MDGLFVQYFMEGPTNNSMQNFEPLLAPTNNLGLNLIDLVLENLGQKWTLTVTITKNEEW